MDPCYVNNILQNGLKTPKNAQKTEGDQSNIMAFMQSIGRILTYLK